MSNVTNHLSATFLQLQLQAPAGLRLWAPLRLIGLVASVTSQNEARREARPDGLMEWNMDRLVCSVPLLSLSMLSSQPIYHMTVFPELKWLIKRIDQIRRSFLRRGETPDRVYGGHSIINWPTSCRPKIKGGLGILDLERFARALRLR
jgi:hypothetical protein